jgi:DnaJ-domain-containing protein 1
VPRISNLLKESEKKKEMLIRNFKTCSRANPHLKIFRTFAIEDDAKKILGLKCYYQILDVPRTATKIQIKKKYRDMTKVYHPDIWKNEQADPVY